MISIFAQSVFCVNIATFNISDSLKPDFSIRFRVNDRENANPIAGVKVKVENNITKTHEFFETDHNGEFVKVLAAYKMHDRLNLSLPFEKKGYLTKHGGYDKRPQ